MFLPILKGQWWLFLGASVSLVIALVHVAVAIIAPDACAFFGGWGWRVPRRPGPGSPCS
jgi:hypothetical protein